MSISDRILMGLIAAGVILAVAGIIRGAFVMRKQFEIGRRFGRDRYR